MLHSNKVINLLKVTAVLFAASLLFSCTPYRYFPSRVEFYSFDTSNEARVVLEPYLLGYNIGGAYSIINHWAVTANYRRDYTETGDVDEGVPYGNASDRAFNFGVGYFYKFNYHNGFDVFIQYEYERVNGEMSFFDENNYQYYNLDTFNYKYHSFSIQPSYYYKFDKYTTLGFICRATLLVDNYFANDTTQTQITVTRHYKLGDFIVTPGIQLNIGPLSLGIFYNWDTDVKTKFLSYGPPNYFYQPLVLNMKWTIPFSTKKDKYLFYNDLFK